MIIITLTQGKTAIIDDIDAEKAKGFKWHAQKAGQTWYAASWTRIGHIGKKWGIARKAEYISLHRLIMECPPEKEIDHIDGDGLNCRRDNLRICTRTRNAQHALRAKLGKARFRGVSFLGNVYRAKPWQARIGVNGKFIHLGCFQTAKEAAIAYNTASFKYHGEFGIRNMIV
jgi:hypothetical protein